MVLLYRSPDLITWEYLGPLFQGELSETGHNWECPNFVPMGDRHLLIFSPQPLQQAHYYLGDYADHRFTPQEHGLLDYGGLYYAPQVFWDESSRCICFGWLLEGRTQEAYLAAGWAGVQSLPRELTLGADGHLRQRPAPELASLRRMHVGMAPQPIQGLTPLPQVSGACLELNVTLDPHQAQRVGLMVRRSNDGAEAVSIAYDAAQRKLIVDSRAASLSPQAEGRLAEVALDLQGEPLALRVFLDQSVIEVFANERICATARVYPTREDSLGVALTASGGAARLLALDAWRMVSIWSGNPDA